jgi:hypothetical protein
MPSFAGIKESIGHVIISGGAQHKNGCFFHIFTPMLRDISRQVFFGKKATAEQYRAHPKNGPGDFFGPDTLFKVRPGASSW